MSSIDITKDLFLCPVFFDGDPVDANGNPTPLLYADKNLHFTEQSAQMVGDGSGIFLMDELPTEYEPAVIGSDSVMHFREINAPDGAAFIPLFVSYAALVGIFGTNIHIGVISYNEATRLCVEDEQIAGVVIGPGQFNEIVPREDLVD